MHKPLCLNKYVETDFLKDDSVTYFCERNQGHKGHHWETFDTPDGGFKRVEWWYSEQPSKEKQLENLRKKMWGN